jgi:hypothetical protein
LLGRERKEKEENMKRSLKRIASREGQGWETGGNMKRIRLERKE